MTWSFIQTQSKHPYFCFPGAGKTGGKKDEVFTHQTSSASTSHSAPNWQISQVEVSFWPVSAEPSPPTNDRKRQRKKSTCNTEADWYPIQVAGKTQRQYYPITNDLYNYTFPKVHLHPCIWTWKAQWSLLLQPSPFLRPLLSLAWFHLSFPVSTLISMDSLFYSVLLIFLHWVLEVLGGAGVSLMAA